MTTTIKTENISSHSKNKTERLFWLGRYAERVYMTLHLLRKHFDMMIDEDENAYITFCTKMGIVNIYTSADDFTQQYLYDENNSDSVINMLELTKSNAMVLREELKSETLSYIEMSILHINQCKLKNCSINELQIITDYMLAFWGSLDERVLNLQSRHIIKSGKFIESADLHIRFEYPFNRVNAIYKLMLEFIEKESYICNNQNLKELELYMNVYDYRKPQTLDLINNIFST